ncbi:hypothetical protein GWI33_015826, partial [Rhynchophorus ferrugineus]
MFLFQTKCCEEKCRLIQLQMSCRLCLMDIMDKKTNASDMEHQFLQLLGLSSPILIE